MNADGAKPPGWHSQKPLEEELNPTPQLSVWVCTGVQQAPAASILASSNYLVPAELTQPPHETNRPSKNQSSRPGRRGKIQCPRCRKLKQGKRVWNNISRFIADLPAPCVVDPNDPFGICTPCKIGGHECGPRTLPSGSNELKALVRKNAIAKPLYQ